MFHVSFYDEKGEITSSEGGLQEPVIQGAFMSKVPFIEGNWYGLPVYVEGGEIRYKQENPCTVEGNKIVNVPPNTVIEVDSKEYDCPEGGEIDLNFNQTGIYILKIRSWPYLDKEIEIDYQP